MELRGGGEKVFPVQLMTVRRSRNGIVRSVFLSEENTDYSISVMDVFSRCIGKSRLEIEKELKLVELKSQNPKILRGLATLMFRLSNMERPSMLDPSVVRNTIFTRAKAPAVTTEERERILSEVAEEMHTSIQDVRMAMYADNEDNEILKELPSLQPEKLSNLYNIEQIETVILKSLWMEIRTPSNMGRFIRKARSLGLLYSESDQDGIHSIRVSGPVSILEQSERYGSRLSLLVRYMIKFSDWELDASVKLKSGEGKEEFRYHLDHSVSEYTGIQDQNEEKLPAFVVTNPPPFQSGKRTIYPDYAISLDSAKINILLTTPRYFSEDHDEISSIRKNGTEVELLCIIGRTEKCPKGALCFRDSVDWYSLRDQFERRYRKETGKIPAEIDQSTGKDKIPSGMEMEKVTKHLKDLYPDSEAMTDYLEFMGLPVAQTLEKAGYKIRWKGLRILVVEN